jgi:sulfur relay (sulfurtransferase) complex TusBCD TusD component (DsrE family)
VSKSTAFLFTHYGLGDAPGELQHKLVGVMLTLLTQSDDLPRRMLFYTEGVKLVCEGSPVLEQLKALQAKGVELIICQTCLNFYGLADKVQVGIVGGMPDILQTLLQADKVITV